MQKDKIFWICMILSMIALLMLVALKPQVHLLPILAMTIIIKIQMALQIGLGFYGVWASVDSKLFSLFTKVYICILVIYVLLKVPMLVFLTKFYLDPRDIFSPFPFIIAWIMNKAFYQPSEQKES